jgi:threonine synthase
MLDAITRSGGGAIAIADDEMIRQVREVESAEGVFLAPEGGACAAALLRLLGGGHINPGETVVLFNTSTGLKYLECFDGA